MFQRSNPFTQPMLAVLAGLMISTTAIPAAAVVTETLKLVPDDPQIGSFFGNEVAIGSGGAIVKSRG